MSTVIPHRFRRFLSRTTIFSGAILAILIGLRLSTAGDSLQGFSGAFLAITGVQVALWVLGIRLEILGNTTEKVPVTVGEKTTEPEDLPDERAPERSGRAAEPTKPHMFTSAEGTREYFKHVALPEARVLALAEYDRIEEVGEMDLEKRAKELTARHASDLGLDDEWKEWFG